MVRKKDPKDTERSSPASARKVVDDTRIFYRLGMLACDIYKIRQEKF